MAARLLTSVYNLEVVLAEAGADLSHMVKVNYFTVDVDLFFAHMNVLVDRLARGGRKPTSTLVEVKRLFHPVILFEVESVAVI